MPGTVCSHSLQEAMLSVGLVAARLVQTWLTAYATCGDVFCMCVQHCSCVSVQVIGREKEIMRVCEILSRRRKNNPMLLGEAGVGKTAIAEGLALAIAQGDTIEGRPLPSVLQVHIHPSCCPCVFRVLCFCRSVHTCPRVCAHVRLLH